MFRRIRSPLTVLVGFSFSACGEGTGPVQQERSFLDGTETDPQIGLVVNSTGRAVTMFQLGNPAQRRVIPLGESSSITPVGLSRLGDHLLVPLGQAASVALIDAREERIERFFLFSSGNATGSTFVDEGTALVTNLTEGLVGRIRLDQPDDAISETVQVAPGPTAIVMAGGRAMVVSGNLDESFLPIGNGLVTALNPGTMQVLGTVDTGHTNPQAVAVGPDGLLYVPNTRDFVSPGSLAIIDPVRLELLDVVGGMGVGPGAISIDQDGVAYISGFFFGTIVWDTQTRSFFRGPDDPLCAPLADGSCRGAFSATVDDLGDVYQAFFGSPSEGLDPFVFVYRGTDLALTDSIAAGVGPSSIDIEVF